MSKATMLANDRTDNMAQMITWLFHELLHSSHICTHMHSLSQSINMWWILVMWLMWVSCYLSWVQSHFTSQPNIIPHCLFQPHSLLCKKFHDWSRSATMPMPKAFHAINPISHPSRYRVWAQDFLHKKWGEAHGSHGRVIRKNILPLETSLPTEMERLRKKNPKAPYLIK